MKGLYTFPEEIKKLYVKYAEAEKKCRDLKEYDIEFKKANTNARRIFSRFKKLCAKHGLNPVQTAVDLANSLLLNGFELGMKL